jgi:hypothetical protein
MLFGRFRCTSSSIVLQYQNLYVDAEVRRLVLLEILILCAGENRADCQCASVGCTYVIFIFMKSSFVLIDAMQRLMQAELINHNHVVNLRQRVRKILNLGDLLRHGLSLLSFAGFSYAFSALRVLTLY